MADSRALGIAGVPSTVLVCMLGLLLGLLTLAGCFGSPRQGLPPDAAQRPQASHPAPPPALSVTIASAPERIVQGERITATIGLAQGQHADSILARFTEGGEPRRVETLRLELETTERTPVGWQPLIVTAWLGGRSAQSSRRVEIIPAKDPEARGYRVENRYPHAEDAYTQGLLVHDGYLYESTGQRGESSLRRVEITQGQVLNSRLLAPEYFAEGLALVGDRLYQLTWTSRKGFVYSLKDFSLLDEFTYPTQGWGLAARGDTLYMSDGSSTLYLYRAPTLQPLGTLNVYNRKGPVRMLNELEFIEGTLYANVYQSNTIVGIDPRTGAVVETIDLSQLYPEPTRRPTADVLNGIAYDRDTQRLYLTGKYWPWLYQIKLTGKP